MANRVHIKSAFFTLPREMESNPDLRRLTCNFKGVCSFFKVGLQFLFDAGWLPDGAPAEFCNAKNALPLLFSMFPITGRWNFLIRGRGQGVVNGWTVQGSSFMLYGRGLPGKNIVGLRLDFGKRRSSSRGKLVFPAGFSFHWATVDVFGSSLLHGLLILKNLLISRAAKDPTSTIEYLFLKAGLWGPSHVLSNLFNQGALGLLSSVLSDIVRGFRRLKLGPPPTPSVAPFPDSFYE